MQPMIEQIEIFSEILTVYFNCKYFSLYLVRPRDFTQASVKRIFMHIFLGSFHLWIFMSRLWRRSMNLNEVIYFIQDLENTGKKGIEFLIHWKVGGPKRKSAKSQSEPTAIHSFIMFLHTVNVYENEWINEWTLYSRVKVFSFAANGRYRLTTNIIKIINNKCHVTEARKCLAQT